METPITVSRAPRTSLGLIFSFRKRTERGMMITGMMDMRMEARLWVFMAIMIRQRPPQCPGWWKGYHLVPRSVKTGLSSPIGYGT